MVTAGPKLVDANDISVEVKNAIKKVVINRMEVLGSVGRCG